MSLKTKVKRFLICGAAFSGILMCAATKNTYATGCEENMFGNNMYKDEAHSPFTESDLCLEQLIDSEDTSLASGDEKVSFQVFPPENLSQSELKQFYINEFIVNKAKNKKLTIKKFSHDNGLQWNSFKGWLYKRKEWETYLPPRTKKLKLKDKVKKAFVERFILEKSRDESMSVKKYIEENGLAKQTFYAWLRDYSEDYGVNILGHKAWTKEEKQRHVEEYLKANSDGKTMSVQSYAEKNNIHLKTFYMWLNRYKKKSNESTSQHKMWTQEEKWLYIAEYLKANSGGRAMSINAFVKAYNLKYSTFYSWIKNYLDESYIIF